MKAVLFDLDGTLLPINEDAFTKAYFRQLSKYMVQYGFEPESLVKAVWAGTKRMMMNDGGALNADAFWSEFGKIIPCDVETTRYHTDSFYENEFNKVRDTVGDGSLSAPLVNKYRAQHMKLVLATNPIFPAVAVRTRLSWIGLDLSDFDYITTYENSRYCKPNLGYYEGILSEINESAADCLMIGNNATEDMAFSKLGGNVFLVTDNLENPHDVDISLFPHGSMAELLGCQAAGGQ